MLKTLPKIWSLSILIFFRTLAKLAKMRGKGTVVFSHVVVLQSNTALAIWLPDLLLTRKKVTQFQCMVSKNGAAVNPKGLEGLELHF